MTRGFKAKVLKKGAHRCTTYYKCKMCSTIFRTELDNLHEEVRTGYLTVHNISQTTPGKCQVSLSLLHIDKLETTLLSLCEITHPKTESVSKKNCNVTDFPSFVHLTCTFWGDPWTFIFLINLNFGDINL